MGQVDIQVLLVVVTLAMICRAMVLAYVWRVGYPYPPARYWAFGSAAMSVGALLVSLRGVAPAWVSILVAQTLITFGSLVMAGGSVLAADRRPHWRLGVAVLLATVGCVAWYVWVTPDFGVRTLILSVPVVIFDGYAVVACLQARPSNRTATLRALAGVLIIEAALNLFKGVAVFRSGLDGLPANNATFTPYIVVTLMTIIITTALFVLLAAQRVQERLDDEIQERAQREKTLRLAQLVFENSSESMLVTDAQGVILNVNPAFTALTGYRPDEVIGQTPRMLKSGRQDDAFYQALWGELQASGHWHGEIWNRRKDGALYAQRLTINSVRGPDGRIEQRVGLASDITTQKLAQQWTQRQAHFDALTGLPNRYRFSDQLSKELSRARRTGGRVGLLFMDLNNFKPVNDQHGHEAGDHVLKTVAERWRAATRASDTLARLGGDEYALLVDGLADAEELATIAHKLIAALDEPIVLPQGTTCQVGTSVGGSIYPDHATEMDRLIAAADAAMYEGKSSGGGLYRLCRTTPSGMDAAGEWTIFDASCQVGVAAIDEQHRCLVQLVNQVNRAVRRNCSEHELREHMDDLINYARMHFDAEHALMLAHAYPQRDAHDLQHQELMTQLEQMVAGLSSGDEMKLLQTLKDWLPWHILGSDRQLGAFLQACGEV